MPTPVRPIRLLRSWMWYAPGYIFPAMAPGMARDMVANNWAEFVEDAPQNGYVHRMMEPIKRNRGRPRKEKV
jgi:hypothetical protein